VSLDVEPHRLSRGLAIVESQLEHDRVRVRFPRVDRYDRPIATFWGVFDPSQRVHAADDSPR
jgi:hypothetical protein